MSEEGDLRWRITQKHFFMQNNAKLNCASYHAETNLLVVGFSNGLFGLYEMPDFNEIHKLRYGPLHHLKDMSF
jgi:periodic tryptophan protein 2